MGIFNCFTTGYFSVVIKVDNEDQITAGKILSIIVKNNEIFFLCTIYDCERDFLQFFRTSSLASNVPVLIQSLADPQPLYPLGKPSINVNWNCL